MNYKKIAACAAAVCVLLGAAPVSTVFKGVPAVTVSAADETPVSGSVTLAKIGDQVPITSSSELSEKPTWRSDNENVATVDENGTVTAVGKGTAYVYAILTGSIYKFEITVLAEEEEDTEKTVDLGEVKLDNTQYIVEPSLSGISNSDAKWSSSDKNVATVSESGLITAVGKGACVISAVYGKTTYTLTVVSEYDPSEIQQPTQPGESKIGDLTLSDTSPSRKIDANAPEGTTIAWSSTDENVAKVDDNGVVTAVGSGTCRIYAQVGIYKYYAEITSTYTGAGTGSQGRELSTVTLTNAAPTFSVELSNLPEKAELKWSSDDETVATVDQEGLITAVGKGSCTVTVEINGVPYTIKVNSQYDPEGGSVTQSFELQGVGAELQLTAEDAEYLSMNVNVVTVDENGLVKAVGFGEAVIVVRTGGVVREVNVTVVHAYLAGDANEDGKVNIGDAVAILQYLANSSKYPLTDQGSINADVDGVDGLTGQDAITIQMYDAKLLDGLPIVRQ